MSVKSVLKLGCVVALWGCLAALGSGQTVFKPLGIPGSAQNVVTALNNSGVIMVNAPTPTTSDIWVWNWMTGFQDLGLSSANAYGAAINASGEVVGAGTPGSARNPEAFIWRPFGGAQWLGSLGSGLSAANGINSSETVVGMSYTAADLQHAFVWTQAGGMQDLTPTLTSVGGATAMAVNSSNQVVGYYYPNGSNSVLGFTWTQAGGWHDLGPAGTLPLAINDAGTVVGQFTNGSGFKHAFSWTPAGGIVDLGTLGGSSSTALGINNKGWIVGTTMTASTKGLLHPFLWTPGRGMQDLLTLAGVNASEQANSVQVNDNGVVALATNFGVTMLAPVMTINVSSSVNPGKAGMAVTLTARVNSIAGPPPDGETVQFTIDGKAAGTPAMQNGVASVSATLAAGTHSVVVKYAGDANYFQAKSATFKEVVNP